MNILEEVLAGAADVTVYLRALDTDGLPMTVSHDTSGIDLWYMREGAAQTSITEAALAALTTGHTDGGVEPIDDGYFRLDLPDAAVAAGVRKVLVGGTVTGGVIIGGTILINGYDRTDTPPTPEDIATAVADELDLAVTVRGQIDQGLLDYDGPTNTELAAALSPIEAVTDKLDTMIEDLGSPDGYVFTEPALQNAPTGEGGGLDAAGIRAAIGMASANMDTQLGAIAGYIDTEVGTLLTRLGVPVGASISADIAAAKSVVDSILADTGTDGVVVNAAGLATDAVTEIVTAIFARSFGSNWLNLTFEEMTMLCVSALVAKSSGMDANSPVFRDLADNSNVFSGTSDSSGNRLSVTIHL